jgi:hypothetical protein
MDLRTQGNPTTRNLEPPWGRVSYLRLIFETFLCTVTLQIRDPTVQENQP